MSSNEDEVVLKHTSEARSNLVSPYLTAQVYGGGAIVAQFSATETAERRPAGFWNGGDRPRPSTKVSIDTFVQ